MSIRRRLERVEALITAYTSLSAVSSNRDLLLLLLDTPEATRHLDEAQDILEANYPRWHEMADEEQELTTASCPDAVVHLQEAKRIMLEKHPYLATDQARPHS